MSYQHKDLAAGRWNRLPFLDQMANIGSEVERALNWREENNLSYCQRASDRALELVDLALGSASSFAQRKEIARVREALVDYFFGSNQFESTETAWRRYFMSFTYAARRGR